MKTALTIVLCMLIAGVGLAQTPNTRPVFPGATGLNITGRGTTNFLPKFHSQSQIDSSVIYESSDGNIGIGTTTPETEIIST